MAMSKGNNGRHLDNRFRFNQQISRTANLPTVMLRKGGIKQSAADVSFDKPI